MLKVSKLTKRFQSGDSTVHAVENVSFSVPDGAFAVVIGKSGSGKSTLLSLLGALDKPTSGEIQVGGKNVAVLSDRELIHYRRKKIGFVFQNYNLVPNLSALENVMLPLEFDGVKKADQEERAEALLKEVGIEGDKIKRKPGRLSGGEQQRVAIARSLANKPSLILADEPTGNLDSATGKIIVDLLRELARTEKTTIVAVTHDQSIAKLADQKFQLLDGKLVK